MHRCRILRQLYLHYNYFRQSVRYRRKFLSPTKENYIEIELCIINITIARVSPARYDYSIIDYDYKIQCYITITPNNRSQIPFFRKSHSLDRHHPRKLHRNCINTTYCDNILSRSNYWLQLLGYHDYKIQSTCYIIIT